MTPPLTHPCTAQVICSPVTYASAQLGPRLVGHPTQSGSRCSLWGVDHLQR